MAEAGKLMRIVYLLSNKAVLAAGTSFVRGVLQDPSETAIFPEYDSMVDGTFIMANEDVPFGFSSDADKYMVDDAGSPTTVLRKYTAQVVISSGLIAGIGDSTTVTVSIKDDADTLITAGTYTIKLTASNGFITDPSITTASGVATTTLIGGNSTDRCVVTSSPDDGSAVIGSQAEIALTSPGPSSIPTEYVRYVSKDFGDDASAELGNKKRAYSTLTGAKLAWLPGEFIYVLDGIFDEKNLLATDDLGAVLIDGIKYYFAPNTGVDTEDHGEIPGNLKAIFNMGGSDTFSAYVYGHGKFTVRSYTGEDIYIVASENGNGRLYFEADECNGFVGLRASDEGQGITYTATLPALSTEGPFSIELVEDGVAGSETVTTTGAAITVHVGNGGVLASTASQVATALAATAATKGITLDVVTPSQAQIAAGAAQLYSSTYWLANDSQTSIFKIIKVVQTGVADNIYLPIGNIDNFFGYPDNTNPVSVSNIGMFYILSINNDMGGVSSHTQFRDDSFGPNTFKFNSPGLTAPRQYTVPDSSGVVSIITSQSGVPVTTPSNIGLINIDTLNSKVYVSTGTSSSADWSILN